MPHRKYIVQPLLAFIRRNPVNRFIVGFSVLFLGGALLLYLLTGPVRYLFLSVVDGNYLMGVQSLTAERSARQDEDLVMVFCRTPRVRVVAFDNVRTFYISQSGAPVGQRNLPNGVLYEHVATGCLPLTIRPELRPNDPGKYYFCQELSFRTEFGQHKVASFCSSVYEIKGKEVM